MGKGRPSSSGKADFAEEHPKEASEQHHTPGTDLESAGEEEERLAL